jgi:hypothetical protein
MASTFRLLWITCLGRPMIASNTMARPLTFLRHCIELSRYRSSTGHHIRRPHWVRYLICITSVGNQSKKARPVSRCRLNGSASISVQAGATSAIKMLNLLCYPVFGLRRCAVVMEPSCGFRLDEHLQWFEPWVAHQLAPRLKQTPSNDRVTVAVSQLTASRRRSA